MMDFKTLREKFFEAIMKRPKTRSQAGKMLAKTGAPERVIAALMSEAESLGLIDDKVYAILFAAGHERWGNLKIAHELSLRGVSRENISIGLDEMEDESERARELVEAWRASGVEERKIYSRLVSRGFTSRAIRSAMSRQKENFEAYV